MIKSIFKYQTTLIVYINLYTACSFQNTCNMTYKLDFKTQYNQFYISDKESPNNTASDSFWTEKAHNQRLAMEDGVIGIGIQSYGHVKGELNLLSSVNNDKDYSKYDHIVEGGLNVKSGTLQVLDCPNSEVELELKIKPGKYRVRVYSSNLVTADMDEVEGNDQYKIEIWPDSNMERKVLKQYIIK